MAQKRNLNINPYYDDFDPKKNFYKVLFKPGFPVQTRELTTLQSILQNQIENFGSHVFKEGSVVIPGSISYDNQFYAVKLNSTNFGIEVSLYAKELLGKIIEGETSGTTARVVFVSLPTENNIDDLTVYVKYIDSNNEFIFDQFEDGEFLTSQDNITYGNTTINSGTRFASTKSENATSIGSAVSIDEGIYFIRGYFVKVEKQTIILDEYTNTPSYRVGLKIDELFVSAKQDESLFDNAKGFSNFSAPGADRLQINLTLSKKLISDFDDTDFVELLRLQDGVIRKIQNKTQYNLIRDYLAERTYDESGSYSVDEFDLSVHNSLNDKIGKNGLYFEGQKTEQNNDPSDNLLCVKVSPGKAYVKGYDVEATGTSIIDLDKPRDTISLKNRNIPFSLGNLIRVNNVSGTPQAGEVLQFHSQFAENGVGVGSGRVYTFNLTDSAYNSNANNWDLYLYDIQTYTILTINDPLSASELKESYYIKGKSSGASGYSVFAGNGSADTITLRQTSGTFSKGEQLIINGLNFPRTVKLISSYGPQDIKSLSNSGTGSRNFSADAFLESFPLPNGVTVGEINNSGKTLKSPGNVFTGLTPDTIIRYQTATGDETFNRVESVSADGLTVDLEPASAGGVTGVYNHAIGADGKYDIKIGSPIIRNPENGHLYTELPHTNIATVNTNDSNIMIRLQSNDVSASAGVVTIGLNDFTLPSGISTASFVAFDADRYSLHKTTSGYIGTVTSDTFTLNSTNNTVSFSGFTGTDTYRVNATLKKPSIESKQKQYTRSTKIAINKSNSGVTTSISGLVKNDYYGLRVQDEEISLNYPDVVKVLAVYESLDSNDPTLDEIEFASIANVKDNVIIGENIISSNSKAVARVVEKSSPSHTLGVVYLNADRFVAGEKVTFEESNMEVNISSINAAITAGKYKDITGSFTLDKGHREQFYDYSRLVRQQDQPIPSKKLIVIFDHYTTSSSEGDVFTVSSYNNERFSDDVPLIDNTLIRSTDTLDFRPIVEQIPFSSTDKSPFDFNSRSFTNANNRILAPNEDSLIDYSYYIGRIDKVFIDKHSKIFVKKGNSSESPSEPANNTDVMELATIELPPYLYDPNDASITLVENRRYTMKDIGKIEDRVETLEEVTSLSLLELNTQSLQIRDSNGNERFKSGFFVDDFKNNSLINLSASSIEVNSERNELTPVISSNTIKSRIASSSIISDEEVDFSTNFELLDTNVRKTGRAITLNYEEKDWIKQPLATRVENVNPFHVVAYYGSVKLTPESDNWVRTIRLPDRTVGGGTIVQWIGGGLARRTTTNRWTRDVVVSSGNDEFMRSRNTEFSVVNVKPLTQMYQFLDGNGSLDIIPKLLEIATDNTLENYGSSGIFEVGEEVKGYSNDVQLINFRLAKSNHKYGPYNSPTTTFNINPYVKSENIDSEYSQASKILNIDTFSLSEEAQGIYSGYLTVGMKLVGQSSGAIAYVKNLRLVSDNYGDLIGSFFIRDPYPNNNHIASSSVVKINTGTKTYKITSSATNATPLKGSKLISFAQTKYKSEGIWQERQRVTTLQTVVTFFDPLAQSFSVGGNVEAPDFTDQNSDEDDDGAFLTAVDLFFGNKPTGNDEIRIEIRTVELGTPTRVIIGTPAVLRPEDITTSTTGEIATKVVFDEPIYLEGGKEYAIVLVAETTDQYEVWCAQMGEKTVNTQSLPDAEAVRYTKQFSLGSLFKSQNGSIWTANQYQDMKFKLYKAEFTSNAGTAFFHNPTLDNSNSFIPTLDANPIQTLPKTVSVGIGTTVHSGTVDILKTVGRKITGSNASTNGYGYIVGTGSSVMGVVVTDGGLNYVNDSDVETFTITGEGSGLTLNIAQTNGSISGTPTIVNRGNGYQVGDIIGIVTSTVSTLTGRNAVLTIDDIGSGVDTLFLSAVQGESGTSNTFENGDEIKYYDDAGTLQSFSTPAPTIDSTRTIENVGINSGNYFRVNHFNHGMYSDTNKVSISNVQSSYSPTKLNSTLTSTGSSISVADVSNFTTFEGIAVGVNNPGYLKIGDEIVGYTTVTGSTPGNIEFNSALNSGRGVQGVSQPHDNGSLVYKYELNGVSLLRINKTHDVNSLDLRPDGYYLAIDRGSGTNIKNRSTDGQTLKPQLSFNDDSFVGGEKVNASENILFSEIVPSYDIIIPGSETEASASIRTVSGTSVDGSENSFEDLGFENVELNKVNKLSSVRMVCSRVNETEHLSSLPRSKSFTTGVTLKTSNTNLSPLIYTDNSRTEFRLARINNPITDYASDNRVNLPFIDPHAAIYVSNTVNLKEVATSLKVYLTAYRHSSADIRVLYQLVREGSSNVEQSFELFPGYDNLEYSNNDGFLVRDPSKNSGRPDNFVRSSTQNEFLEYQFSADNLEEFSGYSIKIVMSTSNQAEYPIIKDLRTLAVR